MNSTGYHTTHSLTSRLYGSEHDLQQMQDMLMEGRHCTDDWHYAHVGELLFAFFMVACHLNPKEHIRLWHDDGKLVGYAIVGEDPAFDFQVLPQYEWCGIEAEAISWAEALLVELRQHNVQRWGGRCVSGARQDNVERIAFLEKHGFQVGGAFSEVNLLRSLDEPIPEIMVPAGHQVRAIADAGEISNRADAQREVWSPWSVGDVTDDNYAYLMRLPGYHRELDVVTIAPDGVIAAYVNGWIDTQNKIGDFGPVGARLAYRRQGLTRAVLLESLRRMKAHGMNRVCVSTGVSNTLAIRLYQSVGFTIVNKYLEYVKTE